MVRAHERMLTGGFYAEVNLVYGQCYLKGHNRHHAGKDAKSQTQREFMGFTPKSRKSKVIISDPSAVFQSLFTCPERVREY